MCGICGFYGFRDDELLGKMCEAIKHRGPDQSGIFVDEKISLGHRRLSILDLTQNARQPMTNEDNGLQLIFNGEIYNFQELKKELEKKGHKFQSNTDSEVILHAYEDKGIDCVEDFRGMFAFALWDKNKNRLILCRDRLGKKPLYYWWNGSVLLFASEIKSLLEASLIRREVNEDAFHSYLAFQYVLGEETAIKNIYRLPPGHLLILENGSLAKKKYWDVLDTRMQPLGKDEELIRSRLEALLKESVKLRLISDVPLGVLLSGGLDSSSIVALMAESGSSAIKTFSVGFGEKNDELKYAKVVSERFNTEHREFIVKPDNLIKMLEEIIWHLDEPIADGGAFATFLVSKVVKDYVKVILVGEGADELFGGYSWHKLGSSYGNLVPQLVKKKIYFYLNTFYRGWEDYPKVYKKFEALFDTGNEKLNFLSKMSTFEIKNLLPNCLLMKVDKMTMAHSIEARAPFLDHKLLEFVHSLPVDLKVRNFTGKFILRKIMQNKLSEQIINRKKHGFLVPLDKWLGAELNHCARDLIINDGNFSMRVLGRDKLERLFNPERGLKSLENKIIIWRILIFELWFKQYIRAQ